MAILWLTTRPRELLHVTLKFEGWPWKTIGHLFYATSSFVQHFVGIGNSNWSYSLETPNLGHIRRFLEPCALEIWRMTLKKNRATLLSNIKLYVSFHHHMGIQTGVTVRKRLSWVVTSVTLTFDLDLLHGPYPGSWFYILKILWWYDDGNILKKVWQTDRRTDGKYHS